MSATRCWHGRPRERVCISSCRRDSTRRWFPVSHCGSCQRIGDPRRRSMRRGTSGDTSKMRLKNYVQGEWVECAGPATDLFNAVTGEKFAEASTAGLDMRGVLAYARSVGGPTLRALTFHERARMLKALAQYLTERKDTFYEVSKATGATKND